MVMDLRVIVRHGKAKHLRREASDSGQQRVGVHKSVALRHHHGYARIDQLLLGVERVQRGALPEAGLLAHAVQRRFRRLDLVLGGFD